MSRNGTAPETIVTRVDPATDYRHRLELVEDAVAAVLGRAAAAPAAREERDRCGLIAERILTKAHALVGLLASPEAADTTEAKRRIETRLLVREKLSAFEAERDAILAEARDRERGPASPPPAFRETSPFPPAMRALATLDDPGHREQSEEP